MRPFRNSVSKTNRRVPHISLVFREMWDATAVPLTRFGPVFATNIEGSKLVVSHISRETSEIWGTRLHWQFKGLGLSILCCVSLLVTACSKTEAGCTHRGLRAGRSS